MKSAASYNAAPACIWGNRIYPIALFCQTLNNVIFGNNMI